MQSTSLRTILNVSFFNPNFINIAKDDNNSRDVVLNKIENGK